MTDDERGPRHLGAALIRRRFLFTAWPWRAVVYLGSTMPIAGILCVGLMVLFAPWAVAIQRGVDGHFPEPLLVVAMAFSVLLFVVFAPLVAMPLGMLERFRLKLVDQRPVYSGHQPAPRSFIAWLRLRYTESATWRELAYGMLLGVVVPIVYGLAALVVLLQLILVASPFLVADDNSSISVGTERLTTVWHAAPYAAISALLLPVTWYGIGFLAMGQAAIGRLLLRAGDDAQLREVARSRARLVDAFEAERMRIERDLHDGAQLQLTSLTLQLSVARLDVPDDSPAADALAKAHEQAKDLMVMLRDLIHGIHPQTLTELGLPAALDDLAGRSMLPVTIAVQPDLLGQRLPSRIESTAYFVVSEALTNVAKHSAANRAEVALRRSDQVLVVEVRDDGLGGADPKAGTGLTGLADRVAVVDGRLLLASPVGGPTLLRVELPCEP